MSYLVEESRGGLLGETRAGSGTAQDRPALAIQVNALQAMCRQVFGFRLAMIAVATPFAIGGAAPGAAGWFVGGAIVVTFMGSYVLFRDWERFGPRLLRHRWILGIDVTFGALLLVTATPESTLAYVTVCTPLLAGLVYGWRGAAVFAALQIVIVLGVYNTVPNLRSESDGTALLLPGFCVIAGAVGVTLRNLLLRFGSASQALTETRARLAVNEAVESERTRLAREMHDSVAKTLHGLAMAAEGLAASADRLDPLSVRRQAELVARSARRAAVESRELLTDLRRESGLDGGIDLIGELRIRTEDFSRRNEVAATFRLLGDEPVPPVPHVVARHLLTVASEAMENAHRHAGPSYLVVLAGVKGDMLRISVYDDGRGLPAGTSLDTLRRAGHFGLVGMVERAASIGARIRIGRGKAAQGTEVRLELPLAALTLPADATGPPPSPFPSD
ncbi:sensor histidine kinase [uncultured Streptomyces sp.]|uniref:sensor histidine kinase n=1 Tax=uncultured Streptomyces sp. TaxID=174707 RepID=UPI0026348F29|nr:histidine kinase [uncultured Streptomyces sp.]